MKYIFLILMWALPVFAGTQHFPRLFDLKTQRGGPEDTSGKYLPQRIYMVWFEADGKWCFAMTNNFGEFEKPAELFRAGSVVAGSFLGSTNFDQRYILSPKGTWEPSYLDEQYYFWVLSTPARIKIVGFKDLKTS